MELDVIYNEDCLIGLRKLPDECIDCCITSPPYFNLRDYGDSRQIGREATVNEYISRLLEVFTEVKRVLKKDGALWVNIADVYNDNKSLVCIPDTFKIEMIKIGWICRNEIIWHKPNAMPCSAKDRFNNDYEKFYFFTKSNKYYFETQYEPTKTTNTKTKNKNTDNGKYYSIEQESSVRQGMNKTRGLNIIEKRPFLPSQNEFVEFMREKVTRQFLIDNSSLSKTKIDHWFRRDERGFCYPSVDDWLAIRDLVNDWSVQFQKIDYGLTEIVYETDDINKNINRGRLKRAVWSINTKGFKGCHFAPYPEKLIETPILSTSRENGIVLDVFMGSGTTAIVAKKLNRRFIGYEINLDYINIASERLKIFNPNYRNCDNS